MFKIFFKINAIKNISAILIFSLLILSCEDNDSSIKEIVNSDVEWQFTNVDDSVLDLELLKSNLSELIDSNYLRAIAISYNDQLIFDHYKIGDADKRYPVYSVTKSVLSAAFGKLFDQELIEDENITIDAFLNMYDYNDPEIKSTISVKHLLSMQSGIQDDVNYIRSDTPIKYILDQNLLYAPGRFWNYSSAGTHILSAVFQKITNENPESFVKKHIFDPLEITNYFWEVDANGLSNGGWGLYLTLHDMIKFGMLFSNDGKWNSDQLISQSWVNRSTSKMRAFRSGSGSWEYLPDNEAGYGYLWWINTVGDNEVFSALGYGGQYIVVDKTRKLVLAITSKESSSISYRRKISSIVFNDLVPIFPAASPSNN